MLVASVVSIVVVFLLVWTLALYVAVIAPQREELLRERAARTRAEAEAERLTNTVAALAGEQLRLRNYHAAHAERHQTIRA